MSAYYKHAKKPKRRPVLMLLVVILVVLGGILAYELSKSAPLNPDPTTTKTISAAGAGSSKANICAQNSQPKLIIVSISQRHTWACGGSTLLMSTPVITGDENLASDLTPTGSYHILLKQQNVSLIGCDVDQPSDCWNDFVHYDMIFLYNQYGHYDFHDATWRTNNDFGNISPYSANASHGCVETPLAAMTWLYNWAQVGTPIQIES